MGGDEGVDPGARAHVDDACPRFYFAQAEGVAGAGEGFDGTLRDRIEECLAVAEDLRQRAPGVKVEAPPRVVGNLGVLVADLATEGMPRYLGVEAWAVDEEAAMRLWEVSEQMLADTE